MNETGSAPRPVEAGRRRGGGGPSGSREAPPGAAGRRTRIRAVLPPDSEGSEPDRDPADTTSLLAAARAGDRSAYDRVFARVYDELRRVASRQAARHGASESLSTNGCQPI